MPPILEVRSLGKLYRIDRRATPGVYQYRSLREEFVRLALASTSRSASRSRTDRRDFWALRDVDLEVDPGEVVGIVGRNGAGKSTLLKILARITKPTRGRAVLRGRVGSLLEVGTGFHPELTGRENVFLYGSILGMTRSEISGKFDEIVAFAEVEKFLETPVKRYSSGMYVRLAFAVAAHLEPEILIVDEVLAVGDMTFRKKCLGKMREVTGGERTVLFVSHDLNAITHLCTRCIHLERGRVQEDGEPRQVVMNYLKEGADVAAADLRTSGGRGGEAHVVQLLRLRTLDDRGRQSARFEYGEPIRVEATVGGRPGAGFILGIRIHDMVGTRIIHMINTDDSAPLALSGPESVVTARLASLVLNDGPYYLSIALCDPLGNQIDLVENCLQFTVASPRSGVIGSRGCIRLPAEWRIA